MEVPSDIALRLAQQVGATVSSISTGRVEFTREQLAQFFQHAAGKASHSSPLLGPPDPSEASIRAYASTRGYAVVQRYNQDRQWVWAKGSRQSGRVFPDATLAWAAAADEAAIEEGKQAALARRIVFLATSGYAAHTEGPQAEMLATIAGLARGLVNAEGPLVADDVQTTPPPGWPDGVQLPPDPAVWRAAFVSAQDNGSFYRDYHRTVTAWFAAALQRGAEEAFRALGKKYEDEINFALFPAITAK